METCGLRPQMKSLRQALTPGSEEFDRGNSTAAFAAKARQLRCKRRGIEQHRSVLENGAPTAPLRAADDLLASLGQIYNDVDRRAPSEAKKWFLSRGRSER